jgi:hypothetical protein
MIYKNPLTTVSKLLYLVKVMNEAIKSNHPKTLTEAKLLLRNFEVIAENAISETAEDWPALAAVA